MQNKNVILVTMLLFIILPLNTSWAQDNDERLNVVATTTQAYDIATIIGGEMVDVIGLMGAGVDPHLYKPTEADVRAMNEADLVLYSGLHLEGQFDEVFEGLGERDIRTYALATPVEQAGFALEAIDENGEGTGGVDPHFWFDPRNWMMVSTDVAALFGESDPANADIYLENAEAYNEQLDMLYTWALDGMSQVPETSRFIVTSHDAYQYFGDAYGWEMRGLQGISTEDEAGVGDVQSVAAFVVDHEIPVMFVESSVPPDAIEAVQESVQAQGFDVGIGIRALYSDAMGERETFGGTYIGMSTENVLTILQSFGYEIPEWPEDMAVEIPEELFDLEAAVEE